jgi:hypothetical protein
VGVHQYVGDGPRAPHVYQLMLSPVRLIYRWFPSLLAHVDAKFSGSGWETASTTKVLKAIAGFYTGGGGFASTCVL